MAVLKEWKCLEHGDFERTHPICPFQPCDSKLVVREFRTAPSIRSNSTTRTDAGLKRTADLYGMSDIRSAREGECSKPRYVSDFGIETEWTTGQSKLGVSFPMLANTAGTQAAGMGCPSGMRDAANSAGITQVTNSAVPPSFDTTVAKGDAQSQAVAGRIVPRGMTYRTTEAKGRM